MNFADRIIETCHKKSSRLVVGLDPHWHLIPDSVKAEHGEHDPEEVITRFLTRVVDVCSEFAVAFKPQIAFYERFGISGLRALRRVLARIHEHDGLVIMDGKRNDIGSTATAYAAAFFESDDHMAGFPCEALTVNGYLGTDGIQPFIKDNDNGIFVLVKTSNPSSGELQDLKLADGRTVAEAMAESVNGWNRETLGSCGYGRVGAVVGATYPDHIKRLRGLMPQSLLLVPGYGAQGGAEEAVTASFNPDGLGALINSSRGILFPKDFADKGYSSIKKAARSARDHIQSLLPSA